jgi:hypothetical protein
MNIPKEAVTALMKFGYTERESQFLYVVASFSGHFLRRHFTEFSGSAGRGGAEAEFLKKTINSGHVREVPFKRSNYYRYHLYSQPVYAAIGKENSSHRKGARNTKAILKLRVLDFVLDNFNEDYFEGENDKVQFFTEFKNLSRDVLPAKIYDSRNGSPNTIRYFVDKFPLFIAELNSGADPIPVFTYFEGEFESTTSFATHLIWYKPLLNSLHGQYKFIYVAPTMDHFPRAEGQFQAVLSNRHQPPAMLSYFKLRKLWEAKHLSHFSDKEIDALNEGRKKFSRPEHQELYQQWLKGDLPNAKQILATSSTFNTESMFETYLLRA